LYICSHHFWKQIYSYIRSDYFCLRIYSHIRSYGFEYSNIFFIFFNNSFDRQFAVVCLEKETKIVWLYKDVCVCQVKSNIVGIFCSLSFGKGAKKPSMLWWFYVCMWSRKMWSDGFFFVFLSTVVLIDNFPPSLGKKNKNDVFFKDVCMCKAKTIIDSFFGVILHLSFTDNLKVRDACTTRN